MKNLKGQVGSFNGRHAIAHCTLGTRCAPHAGRASRKWAMQQLSHLAKLRCSRAIQWLTCDKAAMAQGAQAAARAMLGSPLLPTGCPLLLLVLTYPWGHPAARWHQISRFFLRVASCNACLAFVHESHCARPWSFCGEPKWLW